MDHSLSENKKEMSARYGCLGFSFTIIERELPQFGTGLA
jgi:hypothetical protein